MQRVARSLAATKPCPLGRCTDVGSFRGRERLATHRHDAYVVVEFVGAAMGARWMQAIALQSRRARYCGSTWAASSSTTCLHSRE